MARPRRGYDPKRADEQATARDVADAARLVEAGHGAGWYGARPSTIDAAASSLCMLRRAAAARRRDFEGGDAAVMEALSLVSPDAVVWLAARAISYMDETGFPEALRQEL